MAEQPTAACWGSLTMNVQIDPVRLAKFESAQLVAGNHNASEGRGCALNWLNFMAGGTGATDDHPCVSRVLRRTLIRLNDKWNDADRQLLKPYIVRALGTAGTAIQEERRMWMLADFASRVAVPMAFDAVGAPGWAELLREGPQIIDSATAGEMESKCRFAAADAAAYADAAAAYAAADAAAYADAAYAAADVAADADAAAAADAYAADAAAYAADAAAYAAAEIRRNLRAEWLVLLDRMIRVTEPAQPAA